MKYILYPCYHSSMTNHRTHKTRLSRNSMIYIFIVFCIVFYLLYIVLRSFLQSLFFTSKDRINFVIYGQNTAVYSIGLQDLQDYIIPFPADVKIEIPGGYGSYRAGSIGKLVKLDKKPEIYKKAFSLASASLVSYYFYSNKDTIYYDSSKPDKNTLMPGKNVFLLYDSNANFFDKIYFTILMGQRDFERFTIVNNDKNYDQEAFAKRILGLLYEKTYRTEKKNIQIMYRSNYNLATKLTSILEGSGIHVSDISYTNESKKVCTVKEDGNVTSATAYTLIEFFKCRLERGKTGVYDIIFYLDGKIPEDWEIVGH